MAMQLEQFFRKERYIMSFFLNNVLTFFVDYLVKLKKFESFLEDILNVRYLPENDAKNKNKIF